MCFWLVSGLFILMFLTGIDATITKTATVTQLSGSEDVIIIIILCSL